MPEEELTVRLTLKDFVSRGLGKVDRAVTRVTQKMRRSFDRVKKAVFSIKGAFLGLAATAGAGVLAKSFVSAAAEAEKFRTQLVAVFDQNEALADSTLKWVRDFAAATPHMTTDVVKAFVTLKAAGLDAKSMMETLGDTAYVFDQNIADLSMAFLSLEAEPLKRLGIILRQTGKQATITFGGMTHAVDKTSDAIRAKLIELLGKKFGGAMKKSENDWAGMTALFWSQWWEFQVKVMKEGGVLDFLKEGLKVVTDSMGGVEKAAPQVGAAIVSTMETAVLATARIVDGWKAVKIGAIEASVAIIKARIAAENVVSFDWWDDFVVGMQTLIAGTETTIKGIQAQARAHKIASTGAKELTESEKALVRLELIKRETYKASFSTYEDWKNKIDAIRRAQDLLRHAKIKAREEQEKLKAAGEAGAKSAEKQAKAMKDAFSHMAEGSIPLAAAKAQWEAQEKERKRAEAERKANIAMGERADRGIKMAEKQAKALEDYQKQLTGLEQTWNAIAATIGDNILSSIDAAIEGTFDWRESLKALAKDIARLAASMAIRSAVSAVSFAKGGVVPGPAIDIPSAATGRVAMGDQLMRVGDNQEKAEAILPLGRDAQGNLGVRSQGGGGNTFIIQTLDTVTMEQWVMSNRGMFASAHAQNLMDNPGFAGG